MEQYRKILDVKGYDILFEETNLFMLVTLCHPKIPKKIWSSEYSKKVNKKHFDFDFEYNIIETEGTESEKVHPFFFKMSKSDALQYFEEIIQNEFDLYLKREETRNQRLTPLIKLDTSLYVLIKRLEQKAQLKLHQIDSEMDLYRLENFYSGSNAGKIQVRRNPKFIYTLNAVDYPKISFSMYMSKTKFIEYKVNDIKSYSTRIG